VVFSGPRKAFGRTYFEAPKLRPGAVKEEKELCRIVDDDDDDDDDDEGSDKDDEGDEDKHESMTPSEGVDTGNSSAFTLATVAVTVPTGAILGASAAPTFATLVPLVEAILPPGVKALKGRSLARAVRPTMGSTTELAASKSNELLVRKLMSSRTVGTSDSKMSLSFRPLLFGEFRGNLGCPKAAPKCLKALGIASRQPYII